MNFDQIVNGAPLIFVVMGLVELVKAFGVQGKALTAVSFGIGLALGLLYQVSLGVPADYSGWFGAVIFGLALGLVASKVYDAIGNAMLSKANVYRSRKEYCCRSFSQLFEVSYPPHVPFLFSAFEAVSAFYFYIS